MDVEQAFANASADGSPGEDLFYEHVHLTFEGNYRLAHTLMDQIVRFLPDPLLRGARGLGRPFRVHGSLQGAACHLPIGT